MQGWQSNRWPRAIDRDGPENQPMFPSLPGWLFLAIKSEKYSPPA